MLNARGYRSGTGKPFQAWTVYRIRTEYDLRDRYDRLRAAGMLDQDEMAKRLGVVPSTIKVWRAAGLLHHHAYNDKGECLFEPPGKDAPEKWRHQGSTEGGERQPALQPSDEVQYEA